MLSYSQRGVLLLYLGLSVFVVLLQILMEELYVYKSRVMSIFQKGNHFIIILH